MSSNSNHNEKIKWYVINGIIGLITAVISSFFSANPIWKAAILVLTWLLVFCILSLRNWVSRYIAVQLSSFLLYGLKEWMEDKANNNIDDSVWDWVDDQLLVAQGKYAFSIGCIAFRERNNKLECLLIKRKLSGIEQEVLLWPGGRIKGFTEKGIEEELIELVHDRTGYSVTLVNTKYGIIDNNTGIKEKVNTWYPEDIPQENQVNNELFLPPLIVMLQNRRQKYGVKGHIDLIYLATVKGDHSSTKVVWLREDDFRRNAYDPSELWDDTLTCIQRAANVYRQVQQ